MLKSGWTRPRRPRSPRRRPKTPLLVMNKTLLLEEEHGIQIRPVALHRVQFNAEAPASRTSGTRVPYTRVGKREERTRHGTK